MSPRLCLMSLIALTVCLDSTFVAAQSTRPAAPRTSVPRPAAGPRAPGTDSTVPARQASNTVPRVAREPVGNAQPEEAATIPKAGPRQAGEPKPELQFQPVSPEVLALLQLWEDRTKGIKTLACDVKRLEFDKVFHTETRSLGRVQFEQPDHGRFDFGPANQAWMQQAGRMATESKAYKVVAGEATTWICTGTHVYVMQLNNKTYDLIDIPPALQGQNISRSPLPFIFGMKAKEAIDRYAIKLGSMHNPQGNKKDANGNPLPQRVHVIANPFDPNVAKEFVQAEFLLDPKSFLPLNLRMLDPSGNKETVYTFDHNTMKVDAGFGFLKANPFQEPKLTGWQLLNHLKDEPSPPASPKGPLKQAQRPTAKPAQR